jgi:hypothetical protein
MSTIPPPPRKVRLTDRGRSARTGALVFTLPFFLAVLWLSIDIPLHVLRSEALRRDGRETTAHIEKTDSYHGRSWVDYVFIVDGKSYRAEADVPDNFKKEVIDADAQLLPVRYLPSNPENNYPAEWGWSVLSDLWCLIPLAWGCLGILFTNSLRLQRKLAIEGHATTGTVTSCSAVKNGNFKIAYQFRASDGSTVKDTGWSAESREVGSRVDILYLPGRPSVNGPYPRRNYEFVDDGN